MRTNNNNNNKATTYYLQLKLSIRDSLRRRYIWSFTWAVSFCSQKECIVYIVHQREDSLYLYFIDSPVKVDTINKRLDLSHDNPGWGGPSGSVMEIGGDEGGNRYDLEAMV